MPLKDWSTLLIRKGSRQEGLGGIGGGWTAYGSIGNHRESLGRPRKT